MEAAGDEPAGKPTATAAEAAPSNASRRDATYAGYEFVLAMSRSGREAITEHWETAHGFRLGRLVLKNVPVLGELAVFD